MMNRRHFVTGVATLPVAGVLQQAKLSAPSDDAIALSQARQANDDNDNNAMAELLQAGHRRILLTAGKGSGDGGAYLLGTKVGSTNLASGLHLVGDGPGKSVVHLWQPEAHYAEVYCALFANSPSEDVAQNLNDIVLTGFTMHDDVNRTKGFYEHQHLIWLNGVNRLLVENVHLVGFRGDGVMIGAGHVQSARRRNYAVTLRNLVIDGVDKNNRNGVSVIDCDGFLAENVVGVNVTRSGDGTTNPPALRDPDKGMGMPGLFDFEPDNSWNVIRNIRLRNVHARNCGGSAVALLLRSNASQEIPHQHFDIEFSADGCDQGFSHHGYSDESISRSNAVSYDITVRGSVRGARRAAFRLDGTYGARIALDVQDSADCYIGENSSPAVGTRDVTLAGSSFVRAGNRNGNAITVDGSSRNLSIEGVRFDNCGTTAASRCLFIRGGHHTGLTFAKNTVLSTRSMTQIAGIVGGFTGSIDRRTCVNRDNLISIRRLQADNF